MESNDNLSKKLQDYEAFVVHTQQFPKSVAVEYLLLGLASEAGEVAGVHKRVLRQDFALTVYDEAAIRKRMLDEIGDVLWYVTALALQYESSLSELIDLNTAKLAQRFAANTIKGEGDDR